jgi:hypothetical protein
MDIDLNKIIESVSRTRLKGGLFSNACWASNDGYCLYYGNCTSWLGCIAIALISSLVLIALCLLIHFAHRHPQAAIMEGAEFLNYEQIQLTAKNSIMQPLSATVEGTTIVQQLTADDIDEKEDNDV